MSILHLAIPPRGPWPNHPWGAAPLQQPKRQDGSDPSAHAMDAPDVQGIVQPQEFDQLAAGVAKEGGHQAVDHPQWGKIQGKWAGSGKKTTENVGEFGKF